MQTFDDLASVALTIEQWTTITTALAAHSDTLDSKARRSRPDRSSALTREAAKEREILKCLRQQVFPQ